MIQSHNLLPHEQQAQRALEADAQKATGDIGALLLQLEQMRKGLESCQERQRMLINMALSRLGITEFRQARVEGNSLLVDVPDPAPALINGAETVAPDQPGADLHRRSK